MSLYQCPKCGVVENTAVGLFWTSRKEPLCSQCDTGKWHGLFPREDAAKAGYFKDANGYIYHPDSVDPETMEWTYNRQFKMVGKCEEVTKGADG